MVNGTVTFLEKMYCLLIQVLAWGGIWCVGVSLLAAQQSFTVPVNGKNYRIEVSWKIKHAGNTYINATGHELDFSKGNAFDLEVQFRFPEETPPEGGDLLSGFQYRCAGSTLAPSNGEKRARGMRHFQRFQAIGEGNATLTLTPKIWIQTPDNPPEVIAVAPSLTLGFARPAPTVASRPARSDTAAPTSAELTSIPKILSPQDLVDIAQKEQEAAYAKALNEPDSVQRIRALIDFLSQHQATSPSSPVVQKALRQVPLSTSLPQPQKDGKVLYVLNYAVRPEVDTGQAKSWKWELKGLPAGQYLLTLSPLSDTSTTFALIDAGKSPPFNRPRLLQPFEQIGIELLGQTRRDFTLRLKGGTPPFMAYLLQDGVTRIRYLIPQTDTIWTLSKELCTVCKDGAHTLEVFTGDFSTLLLRKENSIHIKRPNYVLLFLSLGAGLILFLVLRKPLVSGWKYYQYRRKLRDIEIWERIIEEEERRRKGEQQRV
jgi:hypothetical protein